MGRLYDKQDLAFNLAYWDRQEQELSADIANGRMPASALNEVLTEMRDGRISKCYRLRDAFDLQRKREQFQLLRTKQLLFDLEVARKAFRACPRCLVDANGRDKACKVHYKALKEAKSAVYWAGENNLGVRNARGQRRSDSLATAAEALTGESPSYDPNEPVNGLNKWELLYNEDKKKGAWPGQTPEALAYNKEKFDSLAYAGWLRMMLIDAEEISIGEYESEMNRLRGGDL